MKQVHQDLLFYLLHLQLELSMLSLGRLSLSTVTPGNLRRILLDVCVRMYRKVWMLEKYYFPYCVHKLSFLVLYFFPNIY